MPNVKPGDLARLVAPRSVNNGCLLEVMREISLHELPLMLALYPVKGPWYKVKILQAAKLHKVDAVLGFGTGNSGFAPPGALTPCPDDFLRRVDPKADEDEEPAPPQAIPKELEPTV